MYNGNTGHVTHAPSIPLNIRMNYTPQRGHVNANHCGEIRG